jgi:ectoine hydroxylase-related dioxygenase (phytanoyl-CoA dioxygenase family)
MNTFSFNINEFPFAEELQKFYQIDDLSTLNETTEVFTRERDQSTKWHQLFYTFARSDKFVDLYEKFILKIIKPIYGETIVYQSIPTFRIAYPNNVAVGEFHKDKYYRDINWATKVKEDNFFLPFTDAYDTNTIWVESQEDKGDFSPMNCNYGEIIQWDGSNLTHGNKINNSGKARVSVDFRVIRFSNYEPSDFGSINTSTKFKVGEYYKII